MASTQITLLDTPSSPHLAKRLQEKCEALGRIHPEVHYCRVMVAGPLAGEADPSFCVTLRVILAGRVEAVQPERHAMLSVAVNRAFAAAAERLAQIAPPPPARLTRGKGREARAR